MSDYDLNALVAVYGGRTICDPSVKEFAGRRVDIRRFGVQAGVNQATQIQNALNSAAGEVEVWFPPGLEFQTDTMLDAPSGTRLVGVPGQSRLSGIGEAFWTEVSPGVWNEKHPGLLRFNDVNHISIDGLTLYT